MAPDSRLRSRDGAVAVFAPVTVLTVTLERSADEREEVHIHPGGQGVWQARMVTTLGGRAVLCTPLGGESGVVLDALLAAEEIAHPRVAMDDDNPTWVQDRRGGDRESIYESPPFVLGRHEVDELFSATLAGSELDPESDTALVEQGHVTITAIDAVRAVPRDEIPFQERRPTPEPHLAPAPTRRRLRGRYTSELDLAALRL